jgi:hypothetical protein
MDSTMPQAWTAHHQRSHAIADMFAAHEPELDPWYDSSQGQPIVRSNEPPLARPSAPHPGYPGGIIQLNCSTAEFANLIIQINQASRQLDPDFVGAIGRMQGGETKTNYSPDKFARYIAEGIFGGACIFMVGISGYSLWQAQNATPTAQMNQQIDRMERITDKAMARNAKMAQEAAKKSPVCIFSLGCK